MSAIATRPKPLFDIGEELIELNNFLDELGEITDPNAQAAVDAWFASIVGAEAEKLDAYASLDKQWEMEEAAATAEAEQWYTRARVRSNRRKYLRSKLLEYMTATGQKSILTVRGLKWAIQANGGKLPLSISDVATVDVVPEKFVRVTRTIDNDRVREALETGEVLTLEDGTPWAELMPRGVHLRLK